MASLIGVVIASMNDRRLVAAAARERQMPFEVDALVELDVLHRGDELLVQVDDMLELLLRAVPHSGAPASVDGDAAFQQRIQPDPVRAHEELDRAGDHIAVGQCDYGTATASHLGGNEAVGFQYPQRIAHGRPAQARFGTRSRSLGSNCRALV